MVDHRGLAASLSIHPDQLFHVLEDHKGVNWFCTGNGLARRVGGTLQRFHPYGKGAAAAYRVVEDTQGNIWVFTPASIFRAGANGLEQLAAGMNAACAYSDRDGHLWIGRKGDGLVRFKDRPFTILKTLGAQKNTKPATVSPTCLKRKAVRLTMQMER